MQRNKRKTWIAVGLWLLGWCIPGIAQTTMAPRYPQGIYVTIYSDDASQIPTMVANPAIAGLTLNSLWNELNPNAPPANYLPPPLDCNNLPTYNTATDPYDFTVPDQAFCAALAANPPRTIQFVTPPGYTTPQWVLNEINSNTCNGEFVFLPQPYWAPLSGTTGSGTGSNPPPAEPPNPTPQCHLAYFVNDEGYGSETIGGVTNYVFQPLPVPWDATYKAAWQTFQQAVAARYGQSPALVSVAVSGPTSSSTEILMPRTALQDGWWTTLMENQLPSQYWNSDQIFIELWQDAIEMFAQTYSDTTLVVTICCYLNASGMPTFPGSFTAPAGAATYCGTDLGMGCSSEYSILSYFMQPGVGGLNAKALQNSGQGAVPETTLGTTAIKTAAKLTDQTTRILGGAQFEGPLSFSDLVNEQTLCPDATAVPDAACSAHQAFYNTIANFFDLTAASNLAPRLYDAATIAAFPTLTGGTSVGTTPMNYLQMYVNDVTDITPALQITTGEGSNPTYTGQQLLDLTSEGLGMIAEQPLAVSAASLSILSTHTGNFTQGQQGTYTVTVTNAAAGVATVGLVTVVDTAPAGLSVTNMAGTGWNCAGAVCTRSDALNPGSSYPPITVTVGVATNAAAQLTNVVTVAGGASAAESASNSTTINQLPGAVTVFSPSQGAASVAPSATLTWGAATGATSYEVYFGSSNPPPLATTTTETSYSPTMAPATTYYWAVTAVNPYGATPSAVWSFTTVTGGYSFLPVTPCRVADTRNPTGPFGGPSMSAGGSRTFAIPSSSCNIPSTAQAYSLNITVVPTAALGYLTAWPAGQTQPYVSTLNSSNGAIIANAAIVPAGTGGAISIYVSDATQVIIDINGYFASPETTGALQFYPVMPCRVADTRNANGPFGGPSLPAGGTRSFTVPQSACSIPTSAQAYSLNMTVVPPGSLDYLTVWPTGQTQPYVSTLNALQGQIAANAAIVPAGTNGAISVYVSDPSNVVIDIDGYFAPPGGAGALYFYPVTPCRVADTRNANGTFGGPELTAGSTRTFPIPSSSCGLPSTAQAYSFNLTVVPPGSLLYLTTWPAGQTQPGVSTLNDLQGQVVANAAIVPAGASGAISVYVSDATNVVIDVNGYFGQ